MPSREGEGRGAAEARGCPGKVAEAPRVAHQSRALESRVPAGHLGRLRSPFSGLPLEALLEAAKFSKLIILMPNLHVMMV